MTRTEMGFGRMVLTALSQLQDGIRLVLLAVALLSAGCVTDVTDGVAGQYGLRRGMILTLREDVFYTTDWGPALFPPDAAGLFATVASYQEALKKGPVEHIDGVATQGTLIEFCRVQSTPDFTVGQKQHWYGRIKTGEFSGKQEVLVDSLFFPENAKSGLSKRYLLRSHDGSMPDLGVSPEDGR